MRLRTVKFQSAFIGLALLAAGPALAASKHTSTHSEVTLVSEQSSVDPSGTVWLGLHIRTKPGWHTYWQNPGDSGQATRISWSLPDGVSAGDIRWPLPQKFSLGPVSGFGYKDETLLMVPVSVGENVKAGQSVTVTAEAGWLVCAEVCIPEQAKLTLSLPVGSGTETLVAPLFSKYRATVPVDPPIRGEGVQTEDSIRISAGLPAAITATADKLTFFTATVGAVDASVPMKITVDGRKIGITAAPGFLAEDSKLTKLDGVLIVNATRDGKSTRMGYTLTAGFKPGS